MKEEIKHPESVGLYLPKFPQSYKPVNSLLI
jgi:hypothetical protein